MAGIEGEKIGLPSSQELSSPGSINASKLTPFQVRELFRKCLAFWEYDKKYLDDEGLSLNDLPEGTVLPSGNRVARDEKGNVKLISPISFTSPQN